MSVTSVNNQSKKTPIGFAEFVALLALTMSLVALSIDTILPALPMIGEDYNLDRLNDQQFMITALFAGLSIGQLIAGPLSDSIGRKSSIFIGLAIFAAGTIISYFSTDYNWMLAGRFIQGLGASAPRIVSIAMVRDRYVGRDMARVMSYVLGVFILVPILAPAVGLAVIKVADWRSIFILYLVIAGIIFLWGYSRLEETMAVEDRKAFRLPVIWHGLVTVCTNRMTICYTVAAGFAFGALLGYVNTAQQIFQNYYKVGDMFALYFAVGAISLGVSFFVNGNIVRKLGMRFVVLRSMITLLVSALAFIFFETFIMPEVPLFAFLLFIVVSSFCLGLCFGNFNALAMMPMGHIAGMASAVIGAVSLVFAIAISSAVGQFYDGNLYSLSAGFLAASILSILMIKLAEPGDQDAS